MVYKKFIKRDGKVFGPYYYESYRDSKGHVKTRFISGPKKADKINLFSSKKMFLFIIGLGIIFAVTLLLFLGNLSYNARTTGRVIDSNPSFGETAIAEQLADNSITSNVDVRDSVDLEVKDVPLENNKIMEFFTPNGKIELNFDLLNYSEFVKTETEDIVEASGFDINVTESKEKYKWGYNVKLADLNFIARIDVTSNQTITVINNQTLRIGEAYLSFADLASQGYTLSINKPVLLNESLVVNETIVINETNVTEMNVSNITEVVTNISIGNESSGEIINITNETIVISNESESGENISVGNESVENVTVGNETTEVVINESIGEDSSEENSSEVLVEDTPEETVLGEVPGENTDVVETPVIDEVPAEESTQTAPETPAEEALSSISGFVVHGVKGLTGYVISEEDEASENTVSVYVQRNFEEAEYNIGDIINLDPSLVFFEQSTPGNINTCQVLDTAGNYVLTQSIQNNSVSTACFLINVSNVNLNCNNFYINNSNTNDYGIYSFGASNRKLNNVTIQNCNVKGFSQGIKFEYTNHSLVTNVNSSLAGDSAIYFYYSYNNSINNSRFFNSPYGIQLFGSDNNNITKTYMINNSNYGLYMNAGGNIIFNNFFNNTNNIYSSGTNYYNVTKRSATNIIGGSYIAGNYWQGFTGQDLDSDGISDTGYYIDRDTGKIDYLALMNSSVNTNLTSCTLLWNNGTYYLGSNISETNLDCFRIINSNTLFDCKGYTMNTSSSSYAIFSDGESNNKLGNVTVQNCNFRRFSQPIRFEYTNNSLVTNVNSSLASDSAIYLYYSYNDLINNSRFFNSPYGIQLFGSDNNNITKTYMINNSNYGLYMNAGGNIIFNNFFNNTNNIYSSGTNYYNVTKRSATNIIGGSYIAGNYWQGFTGQDLDSDRISDTGYYIDRDTGKIDYLALMNTSNTANLTICGLLWNNGTYYLGSNISETNLDCFRIINSNTLFDCKGYTMNTSSSSYAIFSDGESNNKLGNVTVQNCNFRRFSQPIRFEYTNNSLVTNVNSSLASDSAIYLYYSYNDLINNSRFFNSPYGIQLFGSDNNNITKTYMINNSNYGLYMNAGGNIIFNNFFNNTNNIYSSGTNYYNVTKRSATNIIGGSYIAGNYWQGFTGQDLDSDGISDTGYYIDRDTGKIDYLALMNSSVNTNLTSCTLLWNNGTYYLGSNISEPSLDCFRIINSNTLFDCKGYTMNTSSSSYAIFSDGESNNKLGNVTVQNCNFRRFSQPIRFEYTNNSLVTNVNSSLASDSAIYLYYSYNDLINNSRFFNSPYGIQLFGSDNNNITKTYMINNSNYGLYMNAGGNIIFNNFFNNTNNIYSSGTNYYNVTKRSATNIIGGSYIAGNYWQGFTGQDLDSDGISDTGYYIDRDTGKIDYLALMNSSVNTNLTSCTLLWNNGTYYLGSNISEPSLDCFRIINSNTLFDCKGYTMNTSSSSYAIFSDGESNNKLGNVTVQNCNFRRFSQPIRFEYTNNSLVTNVNSSLASDSAIYLYYSYNDLINNSRFFNSPYGIQLFGSDNNNITKTYMINNSNYGLYMNAGGNIIFNNFFNNTNNIYSSGTNYYNVTKRSATNIIGGTNVGGNYWSNRSIGFSDICTDNNGDGICDTNYTIYTNDIDYLPYSAGLRLAVIYPESTTYYSNVSIINYSSSGAAYCWYSTDNGVTNSTPSLPGNNFTGFTSQQGSNTWIVSCNDTFNNKISSSVTFTVDLRQIALEVIYPVNLNQVFNATQNQTFDVVLNVSCFTGNCSTVNVSLDPYPSQCYSYTSVNWDADSVYQGDGADCTSTLPSAWYRLNGTYNEIPEQRSYVSNICNTDAPGFLNFNHPTSPGQTTTGSICYHWSGSTCAWQSNNINVTMCSGYYVYYITPAPACSLRPCSTDAITDASSGKGLINTTIGATPFYTNSSNPFTTNSLNEGDSQVITFRVNATGPVGNNYTFFAFANATSNSNISSITGEWNVTIVSTPPDTIYPMFSNYSDNNATIISGGIALFNVSILNTNGTVLLSINGTNYTATNLTANRYNVTLTGLLNGTYSYNWSSYGSGSSHLFNISDSRFYTVYDESFNYQLSSCRSITSPGVYTMTSNLNGTQIPQTVCFNITTSNVELNCNGLSISNNSLGFTGIYAANIFNITVKNCTVVTNSSGYGIRFDYVNNSFITKDRPSGSYYGIYVYSGINNTLTRNYLVSNQYGIVLNSTSNNTLLNNYASSGNRGNLIYGSNYNQIINSTTSDNSIGFYLDSSSRNYLFNLTSDSNSLTGIWIDSSHYNNFSNLSANTNSFFGIYMQNSWNNTLSNINLISNTYSGASVDSSINNTFNNIYSYQNGVDGGDTTTAGLSLSRSDYNNISNSVFIGDSPFGIYISESSYNNVSRCNFTLMTHATLGHGIVIWPGMGASNYNIIRDSFANQNIVAGFRIFSGCNYNQLINCTANANTQDGICVQGMYNNISNSYVNSNNRCGFAFLLGSSSEILINNTARNSSYGDYCFSWDSNKSIIVNSNSYYSRGFGFRLNGVSNNVFINSSVNSSANNAFEMVTGRTNTDNGLVYYSGNNSLRNFNAVNTSSSYNDINITQESNKEMVFENVSALKYSFLASGAILRIRDSDYGEILFNSAVSASGNNFSRDFKILNNSARVNSSVAGLNVSARVSLYNLPTNISHPAVIRDGSVCFDCYNFTLLTAGNVSFNATSWSNYSVNSDPRYISPGNNSRCGIIDQPGNYNLNTSLIGVQIYSWGCFNLTVSNVTLDCQSHYILNSSLGAPGIYAGSSSGLSNVTVKNCNVTMNSISGYGIQFDNINNSLIINNTANSNKNGIYLSSSSNNQLINNTANSNQGASDGTGIYLSSSSNNTLMNNVVNLNYEGVALGSSSNNQLINNTANSNYGFGGGFGIYLSSSSNNQLINNTANSNSIGIRLSSSSNNTFVNANIWNCTSTTSGCVFSSQSSNYNLFSSGLINLSASNLIYLTPSFVAGCSNNIFKDLTLLGAAKNDTIFTGSGSGSLNNTFLNVSYNSSKEYVESGSSLVRQWYYQAYVNDTFGSSIFNANVTAYNATGAIELSALTNSSGWTNITTITEYMNNGTINYYSNYTISANKTGIGSGMKAFNLSDYHYNVLDDTITFLSNLSCGTIDSPGVYTLDRNIIGAEIPATGCFNITSSNVVLDCQNHYILNTTLAAPGIYAANAINITIKNCNVSMRPINMGGYGVQFYNVNYSVIINTTTNSNKYGIYFSSSNYNNLTNLTSNADSSSITTYAIRLYGSNNILSYLRVFNGYNEGLYIFGNNNNITHVNASSIGIHGVYISGSNNTLFNITSSLNGYGIFISGSDNNVSNSTMTLNDLAGLILYSGFNNTLVNNNISGNVPNFYLNTVSENKIYNSNIVDSFYKIYYNYSVRNYDFGSISDAGTIICINCYNVTYRNMNLSHYNHDGLLFYNTSNSFVVNISADLNTEGIFLDTGSDLNSIINCTANSNSRDGIYVNTSSNNNISGSVANSNYYYGIILDSSYNSSLINNTVNSNETMCTGIALLSGSSNQVINNTANSNPYYGISVWSSSNNSFLGNNLGFNGYGINSYYGLNNSFSGGILNSNDRGIYLYSTNNSLLRDIELINSTINDTYLISASINNTFLNVSYNSSKEYVESASSLIRKWYYQAYVNGTGGGAASNVSVYATNATGDFMFNTTTNSSGWISIQTLIQYVNNGTKNYIDIYMINATNVTDADGHYYNVSQYSGNNLNDVFTINDTTVPHFFGLTDTFVCQGNTLSLYFNVTDLGGDLPEAEISPLDPFYSEVVSYINLTSTEQRIFSGVLSKEDAGGVNAGSKTYNETVTLFDGSNTNSTTINITVIEINNQPSMANFETTYNVIEGDRFYYPVLVNDTEDGDQSSGNLYFNMTISGGHQFFDINSSGILNIPTNSSIRGTYTIEVCATDKGLRHPHPNVYLCPQDGTNLTECKSFILNIVQRGTDPGDGDGGDGDNGDGDGGGDVIDEPVIPDPVIPDPVIPPTEDPLNPDNPPDDSLEVLFKEDNSDSNAKSIKKNISIKCGNWSACNSIFGLTEVLDNMVFLKGERTRECVSSDGVHKVQRVVCNNKVNITLKKSDDCFKDAVMILNENNETLSRLRLLEGDTRKLDIQFFLDRSAYCPYCYNEKKDYDETDVDCGGSCAPCIDNPIRVYSNFGNMFFFIILMLILIFSNILVLLVVRYYMLKAQIKEFRSRRPIH